MLKILYFLATYEGRKGKIYNLYNIIITKIANFIMPILYNIFNRNKMGINEKSDNKVIVSITTYPARIEKIWITLESLLRQTYKPNKIILWLADSQFTEESLPIKLLKLRKRGLEIKYCDDIKSYKKFLYTAKEYNDYIIITADDDVIYPNDWIEKLILTYKKHDKCVCCYRAHEIILDDAKKPINYNDWNLLANGIKGPSHLLLATGVGGILYPPKFFKEESMNIELIKKLCPYSDDIWIKFMELLNDYKVVKVSEKCKQWFTVESTQNSALYLKNRGKNVNDEAVKNLTQYFKIDFRSYTNE